MDRTFSPSPFLQRQLLGVNPVSELWLQLWKHSEVQKIIPLSVYSYVISTEPSNFQAIDAIAYCYRSAVAGKFETCEGIKESNSAE